MTTCTQTLTVYFHVSATDTSSEPSVIPFCSDMTEYGYVLLGSTTLEFSWDSEAKTAAQINILLGKIAKTRADAEQTATELTGMIQSLLALPST